MFINLKSAATVPGLGLKIKEYELINLIFLIRLKVSSKSDKKKMMQIVRNKKDDPESISWLMNKVLSLGGMEYARKAINKYENEALFYLDKFPESNSKKSLFDLVKFVVKRTN